MISWDYFHFFFSSLVYGYGWKQHLETELYLNRAIAYTHPHIRTYSPIYSYISCMDVSIAYCINVRCCCSGKLKCAIQYPHSLLIAIMLFCLRKKKNTPIVTLQPN